MYGCIISTLLGDIDEQVYEKVDGSEEGWLHVTTPTWRLEQEIIEGTFFILKENEVHSYLTHTS